ncbi:methyltransferase domain-containing protein [Pseudodesulfovibrio sp.]|uniref:methyltransferase domain-containing protein n=1 Tax=unclassified Pseudodesulfovibrio TaxID=2661612 RepID=UPI003AFFF69F
MLRFCNDTIGALEFSVSWEKDGIRHEERYIGRKFNPVNDIFPQGMREALEGMSTGQSVTLPYEPRYCIPRFRESKVLHLPLRRLRKKDIHAQPIIPRTGRFYPQGHIDGLLDVYPDTLTPFRLVGLEDDAFIADLNHPLALIPITIEARIQYLEQRDRGTYGSLTHWREATCDWGPGMQTRYKGRPTDFFTPDFFNRQNENETRPIPPMPDAKARENMETVRNRLISPGMKVLDITAECPLASGSFDAAVAVQTFEYEQQPEDLLQNVADRLQPGAPVIIFFTDQWDSASVLRGWTDLHQFERMGLVLEYLRRAGLDFKAGTVSIRNDWRPKDDPRFIETRGVSDPVYAVYGYKR